MDLTPAIEIDGTLYVLESDYQACKRELVTYMNKCEILQSTYKQAQEDNKYVRDSMQNLQDTHKDLRNQFLLLEANHHTLSKKQFIQQYVLARASRIDSSPAISSMVKDAELAYELIVKTCNKGND